MRDTKKDFDERVDGLMERFTEVVALSPKTDDMEVHKTILLTEFTGEELADLFLASIMSYGSIEEPTFH